eukprot:jgi/Chrzof1/14109/Cz08g25130.t1
MTPMLCRCIQLAFSAVGYYGNERESAEDVGDKVKETAGYVSDAARKAKDTAKDTLKGAYDKNRMYNAADEASRSARDTGESVIDSMKRATDKVSDTVKDTYEKAKDTVKDTVERVVPDMAGPETETVLVKDSDADDIYRDAMGNRYKKLADDDDADTAGKRDDIGYRGS